MLRATQRTSVSIASPHNAWATGEAIDTLVRCVARNIEAYLKK